MSTEEAISRKDKKAQRDSERHKAGKTKKRKLNETEDNDELKVEAVKQEDGVEDAVSKPKKSSKKRKVDTIDTIAENAPEVKDEEKADTAASKPKKRKKKSATATAGDDTTTAQDDNPNDAEEATTKSKFIVFIGNLPYKTTDATLTAHFKSLQPFHLRHRTDPQTKRSKGFAFLEFENYDRMKTCLKLFHHSMFDPEAKEVGGTGKGNGKAGRKINVELTAGGGGKTQGRQDKIKVKNERLEEQRKRRAEVERKEKERKEKKEGKKATAAGGKDDKEEKKPEVDVAAIAKAQGVHPSRLRRGVDF
ncbi:hypothetical protein TI39_contig4278g00022 [Zymoseptoria brevis]|uniref:RRM domain-containing protein n=1 Tax=Zymoseptoria brevis TaxID=1047168 RepID=A0A0F4G8G3_9PEZI|nr:hypothetical protein TI39_contig4278g00022 [Zymoseptoria brevis]